MVDLWCRYLSYQTSLAWIVNKMVSSHGVGWQEGEATYRYKKHRNEVTWASIVLCVPFLLEIFTALCCLSIWWTAQRLLAKTLRLRLGWLLDVHNQVSLSCVSYVAMATLTMDSVTFSTTIWYQKCTKVYDSVGRQWNSTGLKCMCRHLKPGSFSSFGSGNMANQHTINFQTLNWKY